MEEEWRLEAKRITKYSPEFRSGSGAYLKNDWTSYSDIGKIFNGDILTHLQYEEVERHYIDFLTQLMTTIISAQQIELREIYFYSEREDLINKNDKALVHTWDLIKLNQDNKYDIADLESIAKLVLREYLDVEIVVIGEVYSCVVRFGSDLYMYINSNIDNEALSLLAKKSGLFCE